MSPRWRELAMRPLEASEQALYFQWLDYVSIGGQPLRPHAYHVANGGSRNPIEAARLKAQGVTPGVPDIAIDVAAGKFHGLRIELKRIGEKPTTEQQAAIARLLSQGYHATVCQGFDEARRETVRYFATAGIQVLDRWAT